MAVGKKAAKMVSVADVVVAENFREPDDLGPFVRRILELFEVPSPPMARPLFEALLRVAQAVPWLETVLGYSALDRIPRVLERFPTEGRVGRAAAQVALVGDYSLAGAIVGGEATPQPGPENLRAALWACSASWAESGEHRTTVSELAAVIRGAVKNRNKAATDAHPVAKHLASIEKAGSLDELLSVTEVFRTSEQRNVRKIWPDVSVKLSELRDRVATVPTAPAKRAAPTRKQPTTTHTDDDGGVEDLIDGIRRIRIQPPAALNDLVPGEPPADISSSIMVGPVVGRVSNPDARRLAEYKARQVVWGQNSLLLTNHPDVLPANLLKRALRIMVEDLQDSLEAGLRLGLEGLLLQAVTGRTSRMLEAIRVVDGFNHVASAPCELSIPAGGLRVKVFFAEEVDAPTGYFRPNATQSERLEPWTDSFLLPLPPCVIHALEGGELLAKLSRITADELDSVLREAARYVSGRMGVPITAGQVRRSFAAHVFESCRDTALTQLICADTLGLSEAPAHYYAPLACRASDAYRTVLGDWFGVPVPLLQAGGHDRIGARLLVRRDQVREMTSSLAAALHAGVEHMADSQRIGHIHEAMVRQLGCMLMAVGTHRPVDALFRLGLNDMDLESGAVLFRDKIHDPAHDPRLATLPQIVTRQVNAYLEHLAGLGERLPYLSDEIADIQAGRAPLLFGLDAAGRHAPLTVAKFSALLPKAWTALPLNWGRTWIRTRGVELGLAPELASIQLGHLEAVGYPFSNASPTEPPAIVIATRPFLERIAVEQGWVVRRGLAGRLLKCPPPPLQLWSSQIKTHEQAARDLAAQWRQSQKARMKAYRRQAEVDVLTRPEIVEAGIDLLYADKQGPGTRHAMTKEGAEKLRDAMFEEAGSDIPLGLARAEALARILRSVNRRVDMQGQEPSGLLLLRRPVDNAFVPNMMVAVRQVRALRQHVLDRSAQRPGDWRDFALACARVAQALALFGFCDDPGQIEGVLRHRRRIIRSAKLDDLILAPWGSSSEQVLGVRGLAALAVARLAKKYPDQEVPTRREINRALATLLPSWASKGDDLLALLCETVSVSNRFELSPATRMALDARTGSVCAHPMAQVALIDSDPLGSMDRRWEAADQISSRSAATLATGGSGNARSQYLALCRSIPAAGKDLHLPLTGQDVAANDLFNDRTRTKVIAEVTQQLATRAPNKILRPAVRLLATWVLEMLTEGTQARSKPADRTISTYLTRIGGRVVEIFGNSSLVDLDDAELEDAYLSVVESSRRARDKAAAAILDFHECCVRNFGFPELDLSEVRAFLETDRRAVDAVLVLPVEREAAMNLLAQQGLRTDVCGAAGVALARVERQAAAAMPLYAYAGARKSEVLGLRFADVCIANDDTNLVRIRANRSRRLKTAAARRTIQLSVSLPEAAAVRFSAWVRADRTRLPGYRSEHAYVFSPIDNGRLATGRSDIAETCLRALARVTARGSERLHRLRHLVAFERITPLFLAERDRQALSGVLKSAPSEPTGIALPRDLASQVIMLGHAHWRTTLRSYHHLPWLLRSTADAVIQSRYANRRGAASVMGVALPTVDRTTQLAKPIPPEKAWLDQAAPARLVPVPKADPLAMLERARHAWAAMELGALLSLVERTGSLERALDLMGGDILDADRIRKEFLVFEKRLGRRLIGGEWLEAVDMPRRIVRELAQASRLTEWWSVFDQGPEDQRRRLAELANQAFEWMSPRDGDLIIVGDNTTADVLRSVLVEVGFAEEVIERHALAIGSCQIRVMRTSDSEHPGSSQGGSTAQNRFLGLSVKRALGVVWVADRLRKELLSPASEKAR